MRVDQKEINKTVISNLLLEATIRQTTVHIERSSDFPIIYGKFTCINRNLEKLNAVYVSCKVGMSNKDFYRNSDVLYTISFSYEGNFYNFSTVPTSHEEPDSGAMAFKFPLELYICSRRICNRMLAPPNLNLKFRGKTRNGIRFCAKILDIGQGGISFGKPEMDRRFHNINLELVEGSLVVGEIDLPHSFFEDTTFIPVLMTVRRKFSWVIDGTSTECCGAEFNMVSLPHKGLLNKLHEIIQGHEDRARVFHESIHDEGLLEECGNSQSYLDNIAILKLKHNKLACNAITMRSVSDALKVIRNWKDDPLVIDEMCKFTIRHGKSYDLLLAIKALHGSRYQSAIDNIFENLLLKEHYDSILGIFEFIDDDHPYCHKITEKVVSRKDSTTIMTAIQKTEQHKNSQKILMEALIEIGEINKIIVSLPFIMENIYVFDSTLEFLIAKSNSPDELLKIFVYLKNVNKDSVISWAKKYCTVADSYSILRAIEKVVNDHSLSGRILSSQVVATANHRIILSALRSMTLDSDASLILAYGLAKYGDHGTIADGVSASRTLPRARLILRARLVLLIKQEKLKSGNSLFSYFDLFRSQDSDVISSGKMREADDLVIAAKEMYQETLAILRGG